ncbi:MAG: hypothetical protein BKP49_10665 [Treponema sp. CETP13]|nr:MAG: hypothetical protein BKP49_10665 [Treponema sp. CETP13]
MTRLKKLLYLNSYLLNENPENNALAEQFSNSEEDQSRLFRSLINLRPPMLLKQDFLEVQDSLLSEDAKTKGIVSFSEIRNTRRTKEKDSVFSRMYLWQGDITRLAVDAIVNAANSSLLGCFIPCHPCIDNVIHSAAGLQLRDACNKIIKAQGHEEATGTAKITRGYNLPAKYVLHTVGPIVTNELTPELCEDLKNSYRSCLDLAKQKNLHSVAFCCVSTGVFHFPNDKAAKIAVDTVRDFLATQDSQLEVIFNVFKDIDYKIYKDILG